MDPVTIGILFRAGVDIDPYIYDYVEDYFEQNARALYGDTEDKDELMDQFSEINRRIIANLRDKHPHREWDRCNELIPYYSKIGDEESMIDSDS